MRRAVIIFLLCCSPVGVMAKIQSRPVRKYCDLKIDGGRLNIKTIRTLTTNFFQLILLSPEHQVVFGTKPASSPAERIAGFLALRRTPIPR